MCRNCGSIVGGGQQQCAVCGGATSGSPNSPGAPRTRVGPDNETMRFARAVLNRPYKFTIILLVANIFVFLVMWQSSAATLSMLGPLPGEVLLRFGAKLNFFIQVQHQWWRFVTPMFLHVNLLHLIVNMYSLWIVGPYVEKLYGSAKFVFFWVLTGIAGVVASYLTVRPNLAIGSLARFIFKAADEPSAGASGALFGLVGVLFVFGIKYRRELPEGFKRAFGTGLLPMIFMNLFIGYVLRGFIDNAAHLGGLLSGALLALVVDYRRPGERSGIALVWRVVQVAAIALVAICFLMTVRHFNDPFPVELVGQTIETQNPEYVKYVKSMSDAQEAFIVATKDGNPGNLEKAIKDLDNAPHLDQKSDELRERLKSILIRASEPRPAADATPVTGKDKLKPANLGKELADWQKDYEQWLRTDARSYSGLDEVETK